MITHPPRPRPPLGLIPREEGEEMQRFTVEYIFLTPEERRLFAQSSNAYLWNNY